MNFLFGITIFIVAIILLVLLRRGVKIDKKYEMGISLFVTLIATFAGVVGALYADQKIKESEARHRLDCLYQATLYELATYSGTIDNYLAYVEKQTSLYKEGSSQEKETSNLEIPWEPCVVLDALANQTELHKFMSQPFAIGIHGLRRGGRVIMRLLEKPSTLEYKRVGLERLRLWLISTMDFIRAERKFLNGDANEQYLRDTYIEIIKKEEELISKTTSLPDDLESQPKKVDDLKRN